jgi:transcriptional regulator with XRE-family HTH domain
MTGSALPSTEIYRLIGDCIRGVRNKRNLTQEQLGERVKLKRTSITNIEKGRQKVLLHTFVEIAAALGVSPKELLSPLEPPEPTHLETHLPPGLSPSVRDWIISGVTTANKPKKNEHSPKVHSRTR